ncbi:hypothetical protein wTkk_000259 [Wolbachia endosymbiont of Trichogramma kaykai]
MVTSYQNFIGIDIEKFKNVAAVYNQNNIIKFDNNADGWQLLFKKFSDILPNSLVTLEIQANMSLVYHIFLLVRILEYIKQILEK